MTHPANYRPSPARDELAARYAELGSVLKLAQHYHVSLSTVTAWMDAYGIARGPRGGTMTPWRRGINGHITPAQWRAYRQAAGERRGRVA